MWKILKQFNHLNKGFDIPYKYNWGHDLSEVKLLSKMNFRNYIFLNFFILQPNNE